MDRQVLALDVNGLKTGAHRAKKSIAVPGSRMRVPVGAPSPVANPDYGSISKIMHDILHSAAEVLDADQAFILISRDGAPVETAAVLNLRPAKVMALTLRRAALPIRTALQQQRVAAADSRGRELFLRNSVFEAGASPATLCLPLEPGSHVCGVMCLIRRRNARRLTALDLEIVHALAEQAALAVGAASHQCALSRLEASLCELLPASG